MTKDEPRFDVIYDEHGVHIDYHYCRSWEPDENGKMQGCYGTNPCHGYSFEEAKKEVISYHKRLVEEWEKKTIEQYIKETGDPDEPLP